MNSGRPSVPRDLLQRQRAFFQSGATRPLEFRRAQLRKLHDALVANESPLLAALHADLRKGQSEHVRS
jgi:aldehyde dehydrogenase (NAD+)